MKVLTSIYTDGPDTVIRPVTEMLIGLKKCGVDLEIITNPETKYNQKFRENGIPVYEFLPKGKLDFTTVKKLRKLLKEGKYDIFQSFHNRWMTIANMATIGLPVINVGYRGVYFNNTDPSYLLSINNPNLDYLLCVTQSIEENVKPQLFFSKPQTKHIYKGQDISWFAQDQTVIPRSEIGIPEDAFVAINLSNVRPIKGVEYFIDAMNYIPEDLPIHIIIAGDGTDSESMLALRDANKNKDKIHLLGFYDGVTPLLRMSDVFVLPTIGIEGISRATMEAMSMSLPSIITRCEGPEELVRDGMEGKVVDRKNAQQIAEAMIELYNKPEERNQMGENAKKRIESEFSLDSYIDNMYSFYQEIVKKEG